MSKQTINTPTEAKIQKTNQKNESDDFTIGAEAGSETTVTNPKRWQFELLLRPRNPTPTPHQETP